MKPCNFQFIPLIFLFSILCSFETFAQKVAIENLKQNVAYPFLDNPLNIIVEGIPCDEIFVSTNNGEIESKGNCEYVFFPRKIGIASIYIFKIENSDTIEIDERKYRIKRWPKPTARIGRVNSGAIDLEEFKLQLGIIVPIENFDISGNFKVASFRFQVIRKQNLFGETINQGGRFEKKTKELISKVESGDRIIVDKIKIKMPGSQEIITLEDVDVFIK